jgi:hypothetical protein
LEREAAKIQAKIKRLQVQTSAFISKLLQEERTWLKDYSHQLLAQSPLKEKGLPTPEEATAFMKFYQQELSRLDELEFELQQATEGLFYGMKLI